MQVIINIRNMTDETIDELWRVRNALFADKLVADAANDNEPASEPASEPIDLPSFEDAKAALQRLSAAKGMSEALSVVDTFGVAKVSEIPEDQRAKFIRDCDARAVT